MKYADVILPLPLENSYTYRIPPEMEKTVAPGCRVIVHFGKKRYYTGIVMHVHERQPSSRFETKDIFALLDGTPVLRRPQLQFWQWIASYYICRLGDVYKAALPAGLKLESETMVMYDDAYTADEPLHPNEQTVLDALMETNRLTLAELEKKTGLRNVTPVVVALMDKGAVEVGEELKKGYTPKTQTYLRLAPAYTDEASLNHAFDELKRAPRQEALFLSFLDSSRALHPILAKELSQKELLEQSGAPSSTLSALLKRGFLEAYEKEVSRLQVPVCRLQPLPSLSFPQQRALHDIYDSFRTKEVCLLHGVTSSGKTSVYVHLISEVLKQGKQVLYLLPEIAITTQLTERLARFFGDRLLVYHSKFSDNERVEVWNTLLHSDEPRLVLGVRSSLFLPFRELGLVVVDEEHENTYKQQDPAPRYHARNAAIVLAGMHGGKALLGSATPSLDTWYNASTGKYGLAKLSIRYGDSLLPTILPVDIKELKRKKIMKDTLFSPLLVRQITEALAVGEQAILFQNRRGFAPVISCKTCGWVPHCIHCDVSLTYHKYIDRLVCHYCGYTEERPRSCPACEETELRMAGFGTEQVEEEIGTLFPEAKVERLDFDTARTRSSYERILSDFERGKTQILIGTQMLSKGLDFGNVSVVGVLNADSLMNYPDFRAHERAYQLMVQVSGRAGRRDKRGTVVLQTSQPEHPLIRMVQESDYAGMVDWQLAERSLYRYPPYYRLIVVVLRSRQEPALKELSALYADKLRERLGDRVLGPVTPVITRVQTLHIRKIILKLEVAASVAPVRTLLEQLQTEMQQHPSYHQLLVHFDVDPL